MINLAYDDRGSGDPVLFIAGRGGAGRTWHLHQVPAFVRAGYRAITFDNRGIGATENAGHLTVATMVEDTATLIDELVGGPVRVVGVSMGSFIAQELMLARPALVSQAVLLATRGRHDRTRAFFSAAERVVFELQIPQAMKLYQAMHEDKKPATHEEFMLEIIEKNSIKLLELPAGHRYVYDPKSGELLVEMPSGGN